MMSGITKNPLYRIWSNLGDLDHNTNVRYIKGIRCIEFRYIEGSPLYRVSDNGQRCWCSSSSGSGIPKTPVYEVSVRGYARPSAVARGQSYFRTNVRTRFWPLSTFPACAGVCQFVFSSQCHVALFDRFRSSDREPNRDFDDSDRFRSELSWSTIAIVDRSGSDVPPCFWARLDAVKAWENGSIPFLAFSTLKQSRPRLERELTPATDQGYSLHSFSKKGKCYFLVLLKFYRVSGFSNKGGYWNMYCYNLT
jgi:hypothetical protein